MLRRIKAELIILYERAGIAIRAIEKTIVENEPNAKCLVGNLTGNIDTSLYL